MAKGGVVYILTNKNNSTLYVGVTSDLITRIQQHKTGFHKSSFSSRYNVFKLIYFETFSTIEEAILREKQLKGGSRRKKINLIESMNPLWVDLYETEVSLW